MENQLEKDVKTTKPYSFRAAFEMIPRRQMKAVKAEIKAALGVKSDKAFYERMAGSIEPKMSEGRRLEVLFARYCVTLIWGEML